MRAYPTVDVSRIDNEDIRAIVHVMDRYLQQLDHAIAIQPREGSSKTWQSPYADPGPGYVRTTSLVGGGPFLEITDPVILKPPDDPSPGVDGAILQQYINEAAGGTLIIPPITFHVSSPITVPSNTKVLCTGPGLATIDGSDIAGNVFEIKGTAGTVRAIGATAAIGDSAIVMGAGLGANFTAGDLAIVSSATSTWSGSAPAASLAFIGQVFRVAEVQTDTLLMDETVLGDLGLTIGYDLNFACTVQVPTMVSNVVLAGLHILNRADAVGAESGIGVDMQYVENVVLSDCRFTVGETFGVRIDGAERVHVLGCRFEEAGAYRTVDVASQAPDFVGLVGATRHVRIGGGTRFERGRYAVTCAPAGAVGVPRKTVIEDCVFQDFRGEGAVNTQYSMPQTTVENCTFQSKHDANSVDTGDDAAAIHGLYTRELTVRGSRFVGVPRCVLASASDQTVVENNRYRDVQTFFEFADIFTGGSARNTIGYTVTDNRGTKLRTESGGSHPGGSFVRLRNLLTTNTYTDVTFEGNRIEDYEGACFDLRSAGATINGLTFKNNHIKNNNAGAAAHVFDLRNWTLNDLAFQQNFFQDITGGAQIVKVTIPLTVGADMYVWGNRHQNVSSKLHDNLMTEGAIPTKIFPNKWKNEDHTDRIRIVSDGTNAQILGASTHTIAPDINTNAASQPNLTFLLPMNNLGAASPALSSPLQTLVGSASSGQTQWAALQFPFGPVMSWKDSVNPGAAIFTGGGTYPFVQPWFRTVAAGKFVRLYYQARGAGGATITFRLLKNNVDQTGILTATAGTTWQSTAINQNITTESWEIQIEAASTGIIEALTFTAAITG